MQTTQRLFKLSNPWKFGIVFERLTLITASQIPKVLEKRRKTQRHNRRRKHEPTIALQNGVDINTVSGMLGHFSAAFTPDAYAHVTTSAPKEATETIGQVLKL